MKRILTYSFKPSSHFTGSQFLGTTPQTQLWYSSFVKVIFWSKIVFEILHTFSNGREDLTAFCVAKSHRLRRASNPGRKIIALDNFQQ